MNTKFYKNEIYNVLTDKGFKHFDGLQVTTVKKICLVKTNTGHFYATPDHEFFYTRTNKKAISQFKHGEKFYSMIGTVLVDDVIHMDYEMNVYDLIEVADGNAFLITDDGIKVSNCCYIDEMAFIENDVDFYTSTYPVLTAGKETKLIITSTPNGMNLFYKIYTDSVNGDNTFKNYKVHWREKPGRDDAWANEQLRNMSESQFAVEFECEFSGSDGTLINGKKLTKLAYQKPIKTYDDEKIRVYEEPDKDKIYVLVADPSEGVGEDFSCINVFDVTQMPYQQVFTFSDNFIVPNMFANVIAQCGRKYNNALAVVESNNSAGGIVLEVLHNDIEYDNILMSKVKDSNTVASFGGKRSTPGVRTTKSTKATGCSYLKDLIETDQLILKDWQAVTELSTFIRKGKSWEAKKGNHDDAVMTLVIFAWLTSQPYFEDVTGIRNGSALRDIMNSGGSDYSEVFGGISQSDGEDKFLHESNSFDAEFGKFDQTRMVQ